MPSKSDWREVQKVNKCTECGRDFPTPRGLQVHQRMAHTTGGNVRRPRSSRLSAETARQLAALSGLGDEAVTFILRSGLRAYNDHLMREIERAEQVREMVAAMGGQ